MPCTCSDFDLEWEFGYSKLSIEWHRFYQRCVIYERILQWITKKDVNDEGIDEGKG